MNQEDRRVIKMLRSMVSRRKQGQGVRDMILLLFNCNDVSTSWTVDDLVV